MKSIAELAREIAIDAKSDPEFTIDDLGIYADIPETRHLSPAEFTELVDEVERLLPEVSADPLKTAAWRQASKDVRAEQRAELQAFGAA